MKTALESPRYNERKRLHWKTSLPFIENTRARLIHRPKRIGVYRNRTNIWLVIECWCNMHLNADPSEGNISFTNDPNQQRYVCHLCESNAVAAGYSSSDDLAGRHVHIGSTKPVKLCCGEMP